MEGRVKTSIYLPDDLAERVRALGIPVSEVAQAALRKAVADAEALAAARAQAEISAGIEKAVSRMQQILAEEERKREAVRADGRAVGIRWATEFATPRELREMTSLFPPSRLPSTHSLFKLRGEEPDIRSQVKGSSTVIFVGAERSPWWAGFHQGAVLVWEAVKPLIEQEMQE
jgi:post-segregation antitoxin (ccd killing protein)